MEEIYKAGGELRLAVTLHDHLAKKKSGRVYLDEFSRAREVPLLKIRHVNDAELISKIRELEIDWLFIIGWSQIAGRSVLEAPRNGVLGMHPTLLPEGRGRAAIPWAILKELERTGVTLFKMDQGVDTGPIISQIELPINRNETATTLYKRVTEAHSTLMRETWPKLASGQFVARTQDDSLATVWPARTPADGLLARGMNLKTADLLVRATTHPYPGAFVVCDGMEYTIWSGRPKPGASLRGRAHRFADGSLEIQFEDGVYEALHWEPCGPAEVELL